MLYAHNTISGLVRTGDAHRRVVLYYYKTIGRYTIIIRRRRRRQQQHINILHASEVPRGQVRSVLFRQTFRRPTVTTITTTANTVAVRWKIKIISLFARRNRDAHITTSVVVAAIGFLLVSI